MPSNVTYGQLRTVLSSVGFREKPRTKGCALEHKKSDTLFLFRTYQDDDLLQWGELTFVRDMLDSRGLIESESFERLLAKAPA